ncbi:methyltransferase domain-containing protein [Fusobacterium varium]|uniref:methyltransferase domain-containing protein n=1 Tax=Fusobacterium TaxID=848 RepID=UPI0015A06866
MEIKYGKKFLMDNMMGPNSFRICEEITNGIKIETGSRILDLGCGKGLTSIFLAEKYDSSVFAADLWIDPTENYERFKKVDLGEEIIPLRAEAHQLPFAHEFFDVIVTIDSYHYFGNTGEFFGKHILPLLKGNGLFIMAIPGLKEEFENGEIPEELRPFWQENMNFYTKYWWYELFSKNEGIIIEKCESLKCHDEAWKEWLECDNEYAVHDIDMMKAENGKYFDTIGIIIRKK